MKLAIEDRPDLQLRLIRVKGRLDSYTNKIFEDALEKLFQDGYSRLLLDMSQLDYINSSGLGTVAAAHQRSLLNNGFLALYGIRGKVALIFKITRVGSQLNIYDKEEDALHAASTSI